MIVQTNTFICEIEGCESVYSSSEAQSLYYDPVITPPEGWATVNVPGTSGYEEKLACAKCAPKFEKPL